MSFDIAQTPTLQAVAAHDEQQLVEDLQQRVDAAVAVAEVQESVAAATQTREQSEQDLLQLRRAERELHSYARQLAEKTAALRETALDALIESMAQGAKPEAKPLAELSLFETRGRHVSQAIQRLVEQRIPLAQIRALRDESHALMSKVKALEAIAHQRAERLLENLRDAVSEEVVLPVDMSKGVVGALLHQAEEFKRRAIQLAANADELERAYMERARK